MVSTRESLCSAISYLKKKGKDNVNFDVIIVEAENYIDYVKGFREDYRIREWREKKRLFRDD